MGLLDEMPLAVPRQRRRHAMKGKSVTKDIQRMVHRIVKEFQPERVIP
jgi:hypothetical protein